MDAMQDQTWRAVAAEADIPPGGMRGFVVEGWPVLIARLADGPCAILDRCSHAAARLSQGRLRRNAVSCHMHGALFQVTTGQCVGDHYRPVRTFPARLREGWIEIVLPDRPPAPDETPLVGGLG